MAKKKEKVNDDYVELEGEKYYVKDYNEEQNQFYSHLKDLGRKENAMTFNLMQLRGGKEYFAALLGNSLKNGKAESDG